MRTSHVNTANKLLDHIRSDVSKARTLISERNNKSSELEELVHLLKLDNADKKTEINTLKKQVADLKDSAIFSRTSIQMIAEERVKFIESENNRLAEELRKEEVLRFLG